MVKPVEPVKSVVRVIPVPAVNVRVSVLLPAVISVCPETLIVLKIFWELPRSELVIVDPETEIPVPDAKEVIPELLIFNPSMVIPDPCSNFNSPVFPAREVTPVFLMTGFCPPSTDIPDPAFTEYTILSAVIPSLAING